MPKPINGFECLKCHGFYPTEPEALVCEVEHPTLEQMKVVKASFSKSARTHGIYGLLLSERYPHTIQVTFSDDGEVLATYTRLNVGVKSF